VKCYSLDPVSKSVGFCTCRDNWTGVVTGKRTAIVHNIKVKLSYYCYSYSYCGEAKVMIILHIPVRKRKYVVMRII
jgi:hypothetical protein